MMDVPKSGLFPLGRRTQVENSAKLSSQFKLEIDWTFDKMQIPRSNPLDKRSKFHKYIWMYAK
jgi:hypothetical protein